MIRRNIDTTLGLVNGTITKVISMVRDPSTDYVEEIKLLLPSGLEYSIESVRLEAWINRTLLENNFHCV